jgi:hypothetical protein
MRTIYPKLITTLFLVLLAAVIARFAVASEKTAVSTASNTQPDQAATKR